VSTVKQPYTKAPARPSWCVNQFHRYFGVPIKTGAPTIVEERAALRKSLIEEEFNEFVEALEARDITEVADALGDMIYVIYGTAIEFGIPLDAVINEIHRSNMSKLGADGKPIYREDGKVLKGPNFFKPDINRILFPEETNV